jgi:hypothetical protein
MSTDVAVLLLHSCRAGSLTPPTHQSFAEMLEWCDFFDCRKQEVIQPDRWGHDPTLQGICA